jgi:hypothetical protein
MCGIEESGFNGCPTHLVRMEWETSIGQFGPARCPPKGEIGARNTAHFAPGDTRPTQWASNAADCEQTERPANFGEEVLPCR